MSEIENNRKYKWNQNLFFFKEGKNDKPLARLTKKKREKERRYELVFKYGTVLRKEWKY